MYTSLHQQSSLRHIAQETRPIYIAQETRPIYIAQETRPIYIAQETRPILIVSLICFPEWPNLSGASTHFVPVTASGRYGNTVTEYRERPQAVTV